jgi:hypothetical protein
MELQQQIAEFVEKIRQAAGSNLVSVVLYGSAAREEHDRKHSDVNLLCVVNDLGAEVLGQVAPVVDWWSGDLHQRPPLFLTQEELATSADVFAIETLDIKASHRILHGPDVLAAVQVPMNLHRIQVEHELRVLLLRLRQHFILAHDESQELETVLVKSVSSAITLLRHTLLAAGVTDAVNKQALPERIHASFGVDASVLNEVLALRSGGRASRDVKKLYAAYMQLLSELLRHIDREAPKGQWQRVGANYPERK